MVVRLGGFVEGETCAHMRVSAGRGCHPLDLRRGARACSECLLRLFSLNPPPSKNSYTSEKLYANAEGVHDYNE